MTNNRLPHDNFVKSLMTYPKVANDFFNAHLPNEIKEKVDLTTLKIESTTFVDEELRTHESDLIFSVKLVNQQEALLYCLVEHQSQSDPLMPFRLLYYIMQGLKRHVITNEKKPLPLPLIFPLVLYNGEDPYCHSQDIFPLFGGMESFARDVFLKPFTLIDVGTMSDEDIRKHHWAGLMELSLRRAKKLAFDKEVSLLAVLFKDNQAAPNDEVVKIVLKYILRKRDIGQRAPSEYEEELRRLLPPNFESTIMNIEQAIEARGEARGEERGRQEGVQQTVHAVEMLKRGEKPEQVAEKTNLDLEIVKALQDNILH